MDNLNAAITANEEAIKSTPKGYRDKAIYLDNLYKPLRIRFGLTSAMDDLNRAIIIMEEALDSIPEGYIYQGEYLANLANVLNSRFELTAMMGDLDRALQQPKRPSLRHQSHFYLAESVSTTLATFYIYDSDG